MGRPAVLAGMLTAGADLDGVAGLPEDGEEHPTAVNNTNARRPIDKTVVRLLKLMAIYDSPVHELYYSAGFTGYFIIMCYQHKRLAFFFIKPV